MKPSRLKEADLSQVAQLGSGQTKVQPQQLPPFSATVSPGMTVPQGGEGRVSGRAGQSGGREAAREKQNEEPSFSVSFFKN